MQEGEIVEVEVEETRDGEQTVEWRQAQVRRIIPGASGRFTACVLLENGDPDEEFVECFDAAQKDSEWRKVRSKAEIAREKREAAAAAKRLGRLLARRRRTRRWRRRAAAGGRCS